MSIYLAAALADDEYLVLLRLNPEMVSLYKFDGGHLFVDTGWLSGQYPQMRKILAAIEDLTRRRFAFLGHALRDRGARMTTRPRSMAVEP